MREPEKHDHVDIAFCVRAPSRGLQRSAPFPVDGPHCRRRESVSGSVSTRTAVRRLRTPLFWLDACARSAPPSHPDGPGWSRALATSTRPAPDALAAVAENVSAASTLVTPPAARRERGGAARRSGEKPCCSRLSSVRPDIPTETRASVCMTAMVSAALVAGCGGTIVRIVQAGRSELLPSALSAVEHSGQAQ